MYKNKTERGRREGGVYKNKTRGERADGGREEAGGCIKTKTSTSQVNDH